MLKHSVEEIQLKSGARGLLIDIPDASVMSFRVNFRAGDIYTTSDKKWETAHIMEHLSLGANKKFPKARDYQMELEKNGAYSNASTAQADMTYEGECADFEWKQFAELFLVGISKPLFLKEEFKAECGNVYEELIGRGNQHGGHLCLQMAKSYGLNYKTMQERAELMKNVALDDVIEHYKKTHFAENMRFVVVGKMKGRKRKLVSLLNSMSLPKSKYTERFALPVEKPHSISDPLFIANKTVPNAYFYIDTHMCSEMTISEQYSSGLLCTILTDTLYSKIFGEAREKGLIYYLHSSTERTPGFSSWWFESQISEKQIGQFLDIFVREIQKVRAGIIPRKDIEAAKMNQLGGFQRTAQTVNAITNGYSNRYFYDGTISDSYTRFSYHLGRVTKQSMVDIANKLFEENIWGIGFLGTISEKARRNAHQKISILWD